MPYLKQLAKRLLAATLPATRLLERGQCCRLGKGPALSFTFDDGPHPEFTPLVLEALRRWNLRATFFVVGTNVVAHPELVERIVEDGHLLGNHTFTHSEPSNTSAGQFSEEIVELDRLLTRWITSPPKFVRPPKGELTFAKLNWLWRTNRIPALWNVDPRDYRMTSPEETIGWARSYRPRHGDIILLHDRVPAAAEIVNHLGESGLFQEWRSVPVDAWLPTSSRHQTAPEFTVS